MKIPSTVISLLSALALIAGPVAAQEKGPRASPEQVKAMETWTYVRAVSW